MKPFSYISRMPSSLVAPQTPAWVVTGAPSSRATSKAAALGELGSPVTSKAIWKPSMSSRVEPPLDEVAELRRRPTTPTARPGCCRRRARTGPARPAGRRRRHPRGRWSAGRATSRPWSSRRRPVPRPRRAGCRRRCPAAGSLAVLEVVPDEVLGQRPVGAVAAHRGLPHVPVGVDHPPA